MNYIILMKLLFITLITLKGMEGMKGEPGPRGPSGPTGRKGLPVSHHVYFIKHRIIRCNFAGFMI